MYISASATSSNSSHSISSFQNKTGVGLFSHSFRLLTNLNFFVVASTKNPYVFLYTLRSLGFSTPRTSNFSTTYHLVDFVNNLQEWDCFPTPSLYFHIRYQLFITSLEAFRRPFPLVAYHSFLLEDQLLPLQLLRIMLILMLHFEVLNELP